MKTTKVKKRCDPGPNYHILNFVHRLNFLLSRQAAPAQIPLRLAIRGNHALSIRLVVPIQKTNIRK
jgi:hypothetical protein